MINAYAVNETRRLVRHPKFYFFDNGVMNGLLKNFTLSEDRKGFLFEHFIVTQILTANFTLGEPARLSTYRTEAGSEVDLILEKDGDTLWPRLVDFVAFLRGIGSHQAHAGRRNCDARVRAGRVSHLAWVARIGRF